MKALESNLSKLTELADRQYLAFQFTANWQACRDESEILDY